MPTNDERRELAARLREPFDVLPQGRYYHASHTLFGMGLYASSEGALRLGVRRLADLIAPEERTCHNISTVPCKFTCSECHQSWREAKGNGAFAYCPCCGAMVMDQ